MGSSLSSKMTALVAVKEQLVERTKAATAARHEWNARAKSRARLGELQRQVREVQAELDELSERDKGGDESGKPVAGRQLPEGMVEQMPPPRAWMPAVRGDALSEHAAAALSSMLSEAQARLG